MRQLHIILAYVLAALATLAYVACESSSGTQKGSVIIGSTSDIEYSNIGEKFKFGKLINGIDKYVSNEEIVIMTLELETSASEQAKMEYYISIQGLSNSRTQSQVLLKSATTEYSRELFILDRDKRKILIFDGRVYDFKSPTAFKFVCRGEEVIVQSIMHIR